MLTEKFWTLAQGGAEWVLYLLLILSLLSIGVMMERAWFFFKISVKLDSMRNVLRQSLQKGGISTAHKIFSGKDYPEAVILSESLLVAPGGPDAVEETVAGIRGQQKLRLERGLGFLGTLGNNAPFIGLFGTVLGIIDAFKNLSGAQLQAAGPKIMASISEALVATAVGLLVAIPAVVAFNFYTAQVKKALARADTLTHDLLAWLRSQEHVSPSAPTPAPSAVHRQAAQDELQLILEPEGQGDGW